MEDLKQIMPKKLGFGCMRLPVANGNSEEIDDAVFCRMIDRYMEQGFVYFDTAPQSEVGGGSASLSGGAL